MKTTLGRLTTIFVGMVCALLMCQISLSFGEHDKHGEKPSQKAHTYDRKEGYKTWRDWEEQDREKWKRAEERAREVRKYREEREREARKYREEQEREARKYREEQEREASKHDGGEGRQGGSHPESPPPIHGPKMEVQTEYGSVGVQL